MYTGAAALACTPFASIGANSARNQNTQGKDPGVRFSAIAKRLLRCQFVALQRAGLDVLPHHFYSEIPDIRQLQRSDSWRRAYALHDIAGRNIAPQMAYVQETANAAPLHKIGMQIYAKACSENGAEGFGPVEAQFLYAYILAHQPQTLLQIGAGVSTSVILQAAAAADYRPTLICVDPFPTDYLKRLAQKNIIELITAPVQSLPPETAARLVAKDLLFIDSTHTLGPAGEVTHLILEWLPRLAKGTRVHFHDISFPYDYAPDVLDSSLFFWHETALLMAFLTMNASYRILCSLSLLHHAGSDEFRALFEGYVPRKFRDGVGLDDGIFPTSIYLERTN